LLACDVTAQENQSNDNQPFEIVAARGITSIVLAIEELDDVCKRFAISHSEIRTRVEVALRSAGIVLGPSPREAILNIGATCLEVHGGYVAAFEVRLVREVRLPDDTFTWAEVWGRSALTGGREGKPLAHAIELRTLQLINLILAANPRQPESKP
jgi:hypothetical protein